MLELAMTFEKMKAFPCSVCMLRMTLTLTLKPHSSISFDVVWRIKHTGMFLRRLSVTTDIISSKKLSKS